MRRFLFPVLACSLVHSFATADELQGVVVSEDGSPVAGVEVQLCSMEASSLVPAVYDTTTSQSNGQFVVNVPDRWFGADGWKREMSLSAVSRKHGTGVVVISRILPLPQHRIKIQIRKWTEQTVQINKANGTPLVDRKVTLTSLLGPIVPSGAIVGGQFSSVDIPKGDWNSTGITDASGEVKLLLPLAENVGGLSVTIDEMTSVNYRLRHKSAESDAVWFQELELPKLNDVPVNFDFTSELVDLDLQVMSNTLVSSYGKPHVTVTTKFQRGDNAHSFARVQPDSYIVHRNLNRQARGHILSDGMERLKSKGLKNINITYGAGTQLTARVVDEYQQPAANIRVFLSNVQVTTDANGILNASVRPGEIFVAPDGNSGFRSKPLTAKSAIRVEGESFDAGDVVVVRLAKFLGIAQNEDGSPASRANIYAEWKPEHTRGNIYRHQRRLLADRHGRFEVPYLAADQKLSVGAYTSTSATDGLRPQTVSSTSESVTLTLSNAGLASVSGQIVDHTGEPAANVRVLLRRRLHRPSNDSSLPNGTDIDLILTTDDDGKYQANNALPSWGEYIAIVHADEKQEAYSGWKSSDSGILKMPAIRLELSQKVIGRVVDTKGKPVGGARVSLLTSNAQEETKSESDGSFQIQQTSGVHPVVIAEADGFLANGIFLLELEDPNDVNIQLFRPDEAAVGESNTTQPQNEWTLKKRQQLALKIQAKLKGGDKQTATQISAKIARYMPESFLGKMNSLPSVKEQGGQQIRMSLAIGLAKGHPDTARKLLEEFPDGPGRSFGFKSFEEVATLSADDRLALLAQMVQETRGMKEPEYRVISMGFLAERLLDIGQRETGEQLLRETFVDAQKLSPVAWSGYARGAFAEEMSQIDADAAVQLVESIKGSSEYNRHLENIAHELAPIDPIRAARLLGKFRKPKGSDTTPIVDARDGAVVRSCYRMVRVDAERAGKLARSVGNRSLQVYAFQIMAESLLATDRMTPEDQRLARKMHDEAWEILAAIRTQEDLSETFWLHPSVIAAGLCRVTKKIAPNQLRARVWQSISLRHPMDNTGQFTVGQGCLSDVALLLSAVERSMAKRLMAWVPSPDAEGSYAIYFQTNRNSAQLLVEFTPEQCEAVLDNIAEGQRARQALKVITALILTGAPKERSIRRNLGLWYPDDEDMGPLD